MINLISACKLEVFRNQSCLNIIDDTEHMLSDKNAVNILIRSRDLECTLVFLSAMPRSATVAIIYALRLLSLHL